MKLLQVMCTDAGRLADQLPNVGLTGKALDDDCVIVIVPDGEDPQDVQFELNQHGDRLGITHIDEVAERQTCTDRESATSWFEYCESEATGRPILREGQ